MNALWIIFAAFVSMCLAVSAGDDCRSASTAGQLVWSIWFGILSLAFLGAACITMLIGLGVAVTHP